MNKYLNNNISFKQDNGQVFHYEITDINKTLYEIHGEKYLNYRKDFELASQLKKWDKPQYLVIETNSYCNMRCKMCAKSYDVSRNTGTNISYDNIKKIALEGKKIKIPSFFIGAESECLINPNIKDIIKAIKNDGGGIDNFIITNGYELTSEISNLLVDLQWERVYVSLDAAYAETYKKIRGKDLFHVEENINRLLKIRQERKSLLPLVRVSFVIQDENKDEIQDFIDKWKDKVDIIDFQNLIHFEKMEIKENLPSVDYQCAAPFRTMMIDCAGNIHPCCCEYGMKMLIGNIEKMTIEDAWNSNFMQNLRTSMIEKNLCSVCRNCAIKTEHNEINAN